MKPTFQPAAGVHYQIQLKSLPKNFSLVYLKT